MSFHGSDSALGSSSLYLDGIPFKIGEKFKRPAKVTLPNIISQTDVTGVLTEEYAFSTEEAVLAWINDVRHSEEVKRQQDLERAQTEAENAAEEINASSGDDSEETEVKEISWDNPPVTETSSCWSNPVIANFSSDLLKPTLISSNSTPIVPHVPNTASRGSDFDIRSFDKVDDPFDNLELEVLDDLEELKSVLQGSHSVMNNGNSEEADKQRDSHTDNNHNANSCEVTKVSMRKNAVKLKRGKVGSSDSVSTTNSTGLDSTNPQYVNFQSLTDNSKQACDGAIRTQLPPIKDTLVTSQRHSVALPPLRVQPNSGSHTSSNNGESDRRVRPNSNPELQLLGNGQALFRNHSESDYENVVTDNSVGNDVNSSQSPSHNRHSISEDYVNVPPYVDRSSKVHAGIDGPLLNKNNLRTTRSTPSLLQEETHSSSPSSISHSPPTRPSSGQSNGPVDPSKPAQRVRVLPERPPRQNVALTESTSSVNTVTTGQKTAIQQSNGPVDPPKPAQRVRVLPERPPPQNVTLTESSVNTLTTGQKTANQQCCVPNSQSDTVSNSEIIPKENGAEFNGRRVGRSTFYENINLPETNPQQQSWNKYTPLPPPRGQNGTKPPTVPPKLSSDRPPEPASKPVVPRGSSQGLGSDNEDPYSSLSIEAQAFVNSLTSMGFPRARAARAVLKLGQDHKLVVEHLCLINSLVDKGYTPPLSEMALHLFTNDFNKAVKYMDLYIQFQELGFQKEKIREALVRNDIDRDKALDFLTA